MLGLVKASTLAAAQAQIDQLAAELETAKAERDRAIRDGVRDVKVWTDRHAELEKRLGNAEREAAKRLDEREEAQARWLMDRAAILAAAQRAKDSAAIAAEQQESAHADAMIDANAAAERLAAAVAEERAANDVLRAELVEMRRTVTVALDSCAAARKEADAVAANLRRQAQEHAEQLAASNRAHKAEAGALRREVDSLRAAR